MKYIIQAIFELSAPPPTEAVEILKTLLQKSEVNDFVAEAGSEEEAKELLGQALRLFPPFWYEIKPKVYQKRPQRQKRGRKAMRERSSQESSSTDVSTAGVEDTATAVIDDVVGPSSAPTSVAITVAIEVHRCADGSRPRSRQMKKRAAIDAAVAGPSNAGAQAGWDDIVTNPASPSPMRHSPPSSSSSSSSPSPSATDPVNPLATVPPPINVGDLVWAKAKFMGYWLGEVVDVVRVTRHINYIVELKGRGRFKIAEHFVKVFNRAEPIPSFVKPGKKQRETLTNIIDSLPQ
uniref:PWWP domain-containing protein n=1 Tax=Photinus pyralis TaxID=7054 RepID=A0A1Y1L283_PHOPY